MWESFVKMKLDNSGVKSQAGCDTGNAYHKQMGFNFEIKPEDTMKNPGLRQVGQICLNSLWAKFGQRCGMDDYSFFYDYNPLIKHFINNDKPRSTSKMEHYKYRLRRIEVY